MEKGRPDRCRAAEGVALRINPHELELVDSRWAAQIPISFSLLSVGSAA
jgi:hypothetical protein